MDDPIMTLDEASSYLKMNAESVRRLAFDGKIKGAKIGSRWRFKKSDIDAMFINNAVEIAV